jgi:subtilase family serine protease
VPDISAIADPYTGVYVYNSNQGGWWIVGGTSLATPVLAGIVNRAGHFYQSTLMELKKVYSAAFLSTGYFDITYGFCGPYMGDRPRTGWDFCTGVGSPRTYRGK